MQRSKRSTLAESPRTLEAPNQFSTGSCRALTSTALGVEPSHSLPKTVELLVLRCLYAGSSSSRRDGVTQQCLLALASMDIPSADAEHVHAPCCHALCSWQRMRHSGVGGPLLGFTLAKPSQRTFTVRLRSPIISMRCGSQTSAELQRYIAPSLSNNVLVVRFQVNSLHKFPIVL
jgi:hypothetical protein